MDKYVKRRNVTTQKALLAKLSRDLPVQEFPSIACRTRTDCEILCHHPESVMSCMLTHVESTSKKRSGYFGLNSIVCVDHMKNSEILCQTGQVQRVDKRKATLLSSLKEQQPANHRESLRVTAPILIRKQTWRRGSRRLFSQALRPRFNSPEPKSILVAVSSHKKSNTTTPYNGIQTRDTSLAHTL